jgi:thymidylate synthase
MSESKTIVLANGVELLNRPFGTAEYESTEPQWFHAEQPYLNYLHHIYNYGVDKMDRTGTGTRSIFGYMMRFNLQRSIPLLTTKSVPAKTVFDELKWFLEGNTNNNRLREINQMHSKLDWSQRDTIWSEWAGPNGELGPIYSEQWRNFRGAGVIVPRKEGDLLGEAEDFTIMYDGFDQIAEVINLLQNSPDSRRILVSAWNPTMLKNMALPPCHVLFQFYTRPATLQERRKVYDERWELLGADNVKDHAYFDEMDIPKRVVNCMLYQRSADSFLGVPFNIASYSMLTYMFADQADMIAGDFTWVGGDCHIYSNHFEQVREQLSRTPSPSNKEPQLRFNRKPNSIFEYDWLDLNITSYEPQPYIPAPVAV